MSISLDPGQAQHFVFVGHDLGLSGLLMSSAVNKMCHWQGESLFFLFIGIQYILGRLFNKMIYP